MRVFLTGGTGFVGSHLLVEFASAGYDVTALARDIAGIASLPGVTVVSGDLENELPDLVGFDALVHNALIWPEEDDSELEMRDVRASARLFLAAAKAGVDQILYTSSTAVHRPFRPEMDETSPTDSNDFYGATKISSEAFLSAVSHQFPVRCKVIRPGPVVGPPVFSGGRHKSDRRFLEFVRAARAGEDIHVAPGDGRQFVDVRDLARLYRATLEANLNREAFVAVSPDSISWAEIARKVLLATGARGDVVEDLPPVPSFRFDVGKLERQFGFRFDAMSAIEEHIGHLIQTTPLQ